MKFTCKHCFTVNTVSDKTIAQHLASKGGSVTGPQKARTSEQARAAVMARIKKLGQKRRKLEKRIKQIQKLPPREP